MNIFKLIFILVIFCNILHSSHDPYDDLAESISTLGLNDKEVRISRFARHVYDLRVEAVSKYVEIAISPPTGFQLLQKTFVAETAKLEYLESLLKLVYMQESKRKERGVSAPSQVVFGEFYQAQPFVIVDLVKECVLERSESPSDDLRFLMQKGHYEDYFKGLVKEALEVVDGKRDPLNLGLVKSHGAGSPLSHISSKQELFLSSEDIPPFQGWETPSKEASSPYTDPEPESPLHPLDD